MGRKRVLFDGSASTDVGAFNVTRMNLAVGGGTGNCLIVACNRELFQNNPTGLVTDVIGISAPVVSDSDAAQNARTVATGVRGVEVLSGLPDRLTVTSKPPFFTSTKLAVAGG